MLPKEPIVDDIAIPAPVMVGIGAADNGHYYIVLEKYFEDFKAACERWHDILTSEPDDEREDISMGDFGNSDAPYNGPSFMGRIGDS